MKGMAPDLHQAARTADPLADSTVDDLMGRLPLQTALLRLGQASRLMAGWQSNRDLDPTRWNTRNIDAEVLTAMSAYVEAARTLPDWADPELMEAAESVFMAHGPLSCALLFCASLPACYQMPQLAEVLHLSGQLEQHTEHRIRQTAAMIFPVMMKGGLRSAEGGGVAQILKVRLIHATIRHLIVHRQADEADALKDERHRAWCRHAWDSERLGAPCSQLELAFTLLTFHCVFLRALRTLGLGLSRREEHAYLHAWNVVGHVLGVDERLMAHDMDTALQLLERLGGVQVDLAGTRDPRPALGSALVGALSRSIGVPVVRHLPVPMIERLLGRAAARRIGVGPQAGLATRALFAAAMAITGGIDRVGRWFSPGFSITRMFTRVIGYHMLTRFLLDQTRPLALPEGLLNQMHDTVGDWHTDRQAPGWINRLEDRLTTSGHWLATRPAQGGRA
jgi:hypothetical protein